jgi:hypothetical protein
MSRWRGELRRDRSQFGVDASGSEESTARRGARSAPEAPRPRPPSNDVEQPPCTHLLPSTSHIRKYDKAQRKAVQRLGGLTKSCGFPRLDDEDVVKHPLRIGSILTVVVMISAWFALSNHCALVAVATATSSSGECPFHSKASMPAKPKPVNNSTCCKNLRAIASKCANAFATKLFALCQIDFDAQSLAPSPKVTTSRLQLDTGPPGARSFAELILQRSILAHAPPLLA